MANSLIDLTLKEIARYYQPGMLVYTKKTHPVKWGKLLAIEREINRAALEDDFEGLERALQAYKQAVLTVRDTGSQGDLFQVATIKGSLTPPLLNQICQKRDSPGVLMAPFVGTPPQGVGSQK